jgi:hypothetical protein
MNSCGPGGMPWLDIARFGGDNADCKGYAEGGGVCRGRWVT